MQLQINTHFNGQLTNTGRSDGAPEPDGTIKVMTRKKIIIIVNSTLIVLTPSPLCRLQLTLQAVFMMTSFVFYSCMLTVKHALSNDIPEESGHFRFLHACITLCV